MRILMLGGTGFVGRHITAAALDAGHDVTLFNRGKTNADVFPAAERLVGDREAGELSALSAGEWDAVVDVNAYVPRRVREAVAALDGRVGHYTFISTCSVYVASPSGPVGEDAELGELDDPTTEVVDGKTYGPLKVLCEREAAAAFPGACTIIRPGIVAGPWDPTERFTHWVRAAAAPDAGPVRAPNRPDQPVQVVHARDQAEFVLKATVEGLDGPFNTVGPSEPLTFASMLAACAAAGTELDIEWVDEDKVGDEKLVAPLYLPSAMGIDGLFQMSPAKAEAAGFRNRPIVETAADTLEWALANPT